MLLLGLKYFPVLVWPGEANTSMEGDGQNAGLRELVQQWEDELRVGWSQLLARLV